MKGNLHEAVSKSREVGEPIIPMAEDKELGVGLSNSVKEYMQGVSNPQMPQEKCPGCGHMTCPPDCPCDTKDCPGRANGRMMGTEPLGGMAHEVTEGTVVEIDGDKITVWKDKEPEKDTTAEANDSESEVGGIAQSVAKKLKGRKFRAEGKAYTFIYGKNNIKIRTPFRSEGRVSVSIAPFGSKGPSVSGDFDVDSKTVSAIVAFVKKDAKESVAESIRKTNALLRGNFEANTVSEMRSGLANWLQMCREAKKIGNDKHADAIKAAIEKVIEDKGLEASVVWTWDEAFEGIVAPEYNRSDFTNQ